MAFNAANLHALRFLESVYDRPDGFSDEQFLHTASQAWLKTPRSLVPPLKMPKGSKNTEEGAWAYVLMAYLYGELVTAESGASPKEVWKRNYHHLCKLNPDLPSSASMRNQSLRERHYLAALQRELCKVYGVPDWVYGKPARKKRRFFIPPDERLRIHFQRSPHVVGYGGGCD